MAAAAGKTSQLPKWPVTTSGPPAQLGEPPGGEALKKKMVRNLAGVEALQPSHLEQQSAQILKAAAGQAVDFKGCFLIPEGDCQVGPGDLAVAPVQTVPQRPQGLTQGCRRLHGNQTDDPKKTMNQVIRELWHSGHPITRRTTEPGFSKTLRPPGSRAPRQGVFPKLVRHFTTVHRRTRPDRHF